MDGGQFHTGGDKRMKTRSVRLLLSTLVLLLAVILLAAGCASTAKVNQPAQAGSSTARAAGGAVELAADLFSPAQDVLSAVNPSVVNIAVSAAGGGG
jgi:hypothetical protein